MRAQQAAIACPDLLLRLLDLAAIEAEHGALLAELAEWQLPVEPLTWGSAYIDLHAVAKDANTVQPMAVELGRRLRKRLGEDLQPSLGWDSGKFTARAAAVQTAPGRMRLVDKTAEARFLNPLPITLLPLPRPHLQQLHWLGVRTLGQFAALPTAGVLQRFGAAGKQAQRWAQGHDDRPVAAAVTASPAPTIITLETPVGALQPVVEAVMASLRPLLAARAAALEGIRRLRIAMSFVTGAEQAADLLFVEPTSQPQRVQAALVQQLLRMRWLSEVEAVRWTLLECGELLAPQLTLFPDPPQRLTALQDLTQKLSSRYGPYLFKAGLPQANHPIPERRSALLALDHVTALA
jgi:nucleotidyltransferase/DNA polymerase involved in DNA repair